MVSRYEVYLINLDEVPSDDPKNTRPAVVVSPDELNRHVETVIIGGGQAGLAVGDLAAGGAVAVRVAVLGATVHLLLRAAWCCSRASRTGPTATTASSPSRAPSGASTAAR